MATFLARCRDEDCAFERPVPDAANALEAAVQFVERWEGSGLALVVVTEVETGIEQCFEIDLEGEVAEPHEE